MMKFKKLVLPLAGMLALLSAGVHAQTAVQETANGDLRVINFQGKPPFKRQVVSANEDTDYTRFQELNDTVLVVTTSSRRAGPPGKSLPAQQASFERVSRDDIVNIARFEEAENDSPRMWKGAPGKGRPRLGR